MTETDDTNERHAIEQTAAEWVLRVQAADVTETELMEWDAWLKADERHREAFDALEATSALIGRERQTLMDIPLPDRASLAADGYGGEQAISALGADGGTGAAVSAPASPGMPRRAARWAIAAGALLAVGAASWLVLGDGWISSPGNQLKVVETQESEHRRIELDDGSRIELGAASSLSINYSTERRTVVLETGEALFEVFEDPGRPFVVLAGNGTITAVGTAFNVRREASRVVVTVTEGEVEVVQQGRSPIVPAGRGANAPSDSSPARQTLAVGERVAYTANSMTRLDDVMPDAATEWRDGRLRYRAEPLKHVIPDVDRYSAHTVIIGDAAVGDLRFTGTVFQDSADEWLRGIEQVFPVEVVELDGERLLLRLREPQEQ